MKFAERYHSWTEEKKNLFILVVIALVGVLVTAIFAFVDNIGVLLGWVLGSAINLICYVSLVKGTKALLSSDIQGAKGGLVMALLSIARLLLYAAGLVLAGFASFRWGSLTHGYCNLISLALAYMPTWITLLFTFFLRLKSDKPASEPTPKEDEQPSEGGGEEK